MAEKAHIPIWEISIISAIVGASLIGAVAWGKATTDIENLKASNTNFQLSYKEDLQDFKTTYREDFKDFKAEIKQIVKGG